MSRKKSRKKRKSNNKLFWIIIIVICIMGAFFIYKGVKNDTKESNKGNTIPIFNENIETYKASIFAAGDVMVHTPQLQAQYDHSTGVYNFDNNFKYVKKYIEDADYSLANLETTLAGNDVYQYSSYPTFNSPDELADALKNAGFDLLSTINNHSFDKSDLGVNRTLSTLGKKGFDTVGTREKSSDNEYIIKDINNIKVGITSYSYGEVKNNNLFTSEES
ncbi:CapA family protein, partial [Terrisporobacter sp.]|uniref:CapA family protein n=1 Tax=Terrisporobacter sp. TaxID=1965305 RepID=UPI0028A031E7